MQLLTQLAHFEKANASASEREHVRAFRKLLKKAPICFDRTYFPGHFTGSAVITTGTYDKILLTHHRKLNRWLQLGGHADGESQLFDVARREGLEESGLSELQSPIVDPDHALFDVDIHAIPARGTEPEHFHFDARYLFSTETPERILLSDESTDLKWFTLREASERITEASLMRILRKLEKLREGIH